MAYVRKSKKLQKKKMFMRWLCLGAIFISVISVALTLHRRSFSVGHLMDSAIGKMEENIVNGMMENFRDVADYYQIQFSEVRRENNFIIAKNVSVNSSMGSLRAKRIMVRDDWQYIKLEQRPLIVLQLNH